MYSAPFEYFRPSSVEEALALLARQGHDAKLLAGGHSLIPAMKLRLAQPPSVIDLSRIAELRFIREDGDHLEIGPMATYRDLESSALVRARCPLIAEVAGHVGDVQVRNKGTIGGSLAHADPAADLPAAILALDAELQVRGPEGGRTVSAANFFVGLMQTAIAPGEILCGIRIAATGRSVAYVKTEQKASGFALCGVAAVIDAHGSARIGITGVASVAYRAHAAEQALAGQPLTDVHVDEAAAHAADGVELLSDIHAPAEYRAHLAAVNTRRALLRARG